MANRKVRALLLGQMEKYMMVSARMARSMGKG
jgi:hypothetical protein